MTKKEATVLALNHPDTKKDTEKCQEVFKHLMELIEKEAKNGNFFIDYTLTGNEYIFSMLRESIECNGYLFREYHRSMCLGTKNIIYGLRISWYPWS